MAKVSNIQHSVELLSRVEPTVSREKREGLASLWQIVHFGMVGILNTVIDVFTLNLLLWFFPTQNANFLLVYNSVAFLFGALNSFWLNKYWTFQQKHQATGSEIVRFALINTLGILCNDSLLWITAGLLHPVIGNGFLWANLSKLVAVVGTSVVTYLGMKFWVFASMPQEQWKRSEHSSSVAMEVQGIQGQSLQIKENGTKYSLSVIMPAHNEEIAIAGTVHAAVDAVSQWTQDFEIIVVNDGSKDQTQAIVEAIADTNPCVRMINHEVNRGYGAALVSGFEAITKDLAFFMDSDGQFDIHDLERFFPLIEKYDAVLGYRIDRQDTSVRKLNAWGWKMLVRLMFKLRIRDVDCAFKLYRAKFFHEHRLETRGAMINTEIMYKFKRAGYTYTEVGVRHLPRRGGRATGAKPSVIARAFREMFVYARKWHKEEQEVRRLQSQAK